MIGNIRVSEPVTRGELRSRDMRVTGYARYGRTSSERIASVSVTKDKGENIVSTLGRTAATECEKKTRSVGRSAATDTWNGEIVTSPPPFSSDVLIEQYRGELLSEEVLHKLVHEFCHGRMTNDQGCCIENSGILQEDGSR